MTIEPIIGGELEPADQPFPVLPELRDVADRLRHADPVVVLPEQLLLAQDRARWLARELAEQVEREGVHGVVGNSFSIDFEGRAVRVGEYPRQLFEAERREREHVAVLAERVARLGVADDEAERRREIGEFAGQAILALLERLGLDPDDPDVRRAAVEAAQAAERKLTLARSAGQPEWTDRTTTRARRTR